MKTKARKTGKHTCYSQFTDLSGNWNSAVPLIGI